MDELTEEELKEAEDELIKDIIRLEEKISTYIRELTNFYDIISEYYDELAVMLDGKKSKSIQNLSQTLDAIEKERNPIRIAITNMGPQTKDLIVKRVFAIEDYIADNESKLISKGENLKQKGEDLQFEIFDIKHMISYIAEHKPFFIKPELAEIWDKIDIIEKRFPDIKSFFNKDDQDNKYDIDRLDINKYKEKANGINEYYTNYESYIKELIKCNKSIEETLECIKKYINGKNNNERDDQEGSSRELKGKGTFLKMSMPEMSIIQ